MCVMMPGFNGNYPANLLVLDGKNYEKWCIQMKVLFGYQEVHDIVKSRYQELGENPTDEERATYRESKKKDCKALFLIHQCIDATNFDKITGATTSKEAWDILDKSFKGDAKLLKIRLQTLRRQYGLLQMEAQESVADYFTRLLTLTNSMKSYGETITDVSVVEKVLRTLSLRFDHVAVAIEESKNLKTMKIEELQGSLEAHEQRMNERNHEKANEQALQAQTSKNGGGDANRNRKGKGKWKGGKGKGVAQQNSGRDDHYKEKKYGEGSSSKQGGWSKKDKKRTDKRHIKCYCCNKYGHFADECWHNKDSNRRSNEEANVAHEEDSDSDQIMLMVTTNLDQHSIGSWYLDTGCSNHMTGHKEWFVELDDQVGQIC